MLVLMTDVERRTAIVVRRTEFFFVSRVRTKTVCVFEAARELVPMLSHLGTSSAKRECDRTDHPPHLV